MSCKYCDALKQGKRINLCQRSTYADDNSCKIFCNNDCSDCMKCNHTFVLAGYSNTEDVRVGIEYNINIEKNDGTEIIMNPFSEPIVFKYCPFCGEKLFEKEIKYDGYTYMTIE
ncbi:hypothetical protein [Clostridium perfringens]|uniref:hypothetical protein n=1 Tax=Clostridium perfringens TaxID=1502 RepID=UPI00374A63BD